MFSGIGGFTVAFEAAGFRTIGFAECDPYKSAVLAHHWPGIRNYGDVRNVGTIFGQRIDCLTAGFPCQNISIAGDGHGLDGEKSKMWHWAAEIIRRNHPVLCLIENVPMLRTRGADRVLGDLDRAGYTARPFVVGADLVGAPFAGQRVWIVAASRSARLETGRKISQCAIQVQSVSAGRRLHRGVAGSRQRQFEWEERRLVEPQVGQSTDGLPWRVFKFANGSAIHALGDSIVPQIAQIFAEAFYQAMTTK